MGTTKHFAPMAATTSLVAAAFLTIGGLSSTGSATEQSRIEDDALPYIRCIGEEGASFTTSALTMGYAEDRWMPQSAKFAALELFGEMRNSTAEENSLYEEMLSHISKPLDMDIFAL